MCYNLAKYPHVQEKLMDEFAVKLSGNGPPSIDELRDCEYLHAFIMESMRMKSTVPINQRVNPDEDVVIGGVTVPKGVCIDVPIGVINKSEKFFGARTDEFRPERFMGTSAEAERARKSWAVFGQHTRMCIGFTFALVEIKAIMWTLVNSYVLHLQNPSEPGTFMIEAGVNQPDVHFKFWFEKRTVEKLKQGENLRWWLQQSAALEGFAGKSNVAGNA